MIVKSISLTTAQADWITDNDINLSWYVQRKITAELDKIGATNV